MPAPTVPAALFPLFAAAAYCVLDYLVRPAALKADRQTPAYFAFVFAVVALALYGDMPGLRIALAVLLAVLFLLGHGYRALTGDTLRPEGLVLAGKPDHLKDALEAVWTDVARMWRTVAAACGWGIAAVAGTLWWPPPDAGAAPALLAPALLAGVVLRAVRLRNHDAYPRPEMPAMIGVLNALALAGKWLLADRLDAGAEPQVRYRYDFAARGDEPVLVVVLMGESIAPDRMGLFQPHLDTTPALTARSRGAGRLSMFWRLGFSGGVASNASLTTFLSGLRRPELGTNHRTLFEVAKAQGFSTHYISPQPRSPLNMTGRLDCLDTIETRENNLEAVRARQDGLINDRLAATAPTGRDLFFLYQRVNHAPYRNHDEAGQRRGILNPTRPEEIVHNYDIGLAAWDRHVESVLALVEDRLRERPATRCFVFVSSDHNELLGEHGLWGHNISGRIEGAVVPMLLFTNAPESAAASTFSGEAALGAFQLAGIVMGCLGVQVEAEGGDPAASYVCNALPYGRAGYMTARDDGTGGLAVAAYGKGNTVEARHAISRAGVPGDRGQDGSPGLFGCRRSPL